jgi:hypothetical protein
MRAGGGLRNIGQQQSGLVQRQCGQCHLQVIRNQSGRHTLFICIVL